MGVDVLNSLDISIHAPRMGSDTAILPSIVVVSKFQSTLPGWGATCPIWGRSKRTVFQSTLPGWGATFKPSHTSCNRLNFNPRSPDGERRDNPTGGNNPGVFQSTLPGWGATSPTV